jgi:hypothetical protein
MKWSSLGKGLVRSLPSILEFVENSQTGNSNKKSALVDLVQKEVKEFSSDVASHPKVLEAVGKAADALVEIHNQVAIAQVELDKGKK